MAPAGGSHWTAENRRWPRVRFASGPAKAPLRRASGPAKAPPEGAAGPSPGAITGID